MQLGGKGANLAEMASIGLSVPPGFTVSTEACQEYQENGYKLPPGLWEEIMEGLGNVEEFMGARLGDPARPLLLSVRSGAAVSSCLNFSSSSFRLLLLHAPCSSMIDHENSLSLSPSLMSVLRRWCNAFLFLHECKIYTCTANRCRCRG